MESIESDMKRLRDAMIETSKQQNIEIITKVITFTNNDVPEFLERLDEYERKSRESRIVVKNHNKLFSLYH